MHTRLSRYTAPPLSSAFAAAILLSCRSHVCSAMPVLPLTAVAAPQWPKLLNAPLAEVDPEVTDIIEKEKNRQWKVRRTQALL